MSAFWKVFSLLAPAVLLAACAVPAKRETRLTQLPGSTESISEPARPPAPHPATSNLPAVPPTPAEKPASAPPGLRSNPRDQAAVSTAPKASLPALATPALSRDEWIQFADWAKERGFGPLRQVRGGAEAVYEARSAAHRLAVTIGSRMAKWNGLELGLGFAPRLFGGQPVIHALDAEKNFLPLLTPLAAGARTHLILVIDPGHGGENTGTQSAFGQAWEKAFTLDWALRLKPLLEAGGWRVFLTRTNDQDVTIPERQACADRVGAALFVSLHFNSVESGNPEVAGIETFCLTPAGMTSHLIRDYEDDPTRTFPNNAFDPANVQWAMRLHQAMVESTKRRDRGVRRARFMAVLRGQTRPAVLLEAGFLSNPQEARLIHSAAYRQKLAEAVAKALKE